MTCASSCVWRRFVFIAVLAYSLYWEPIAALAADERPRRLTYNAGKFVLDNKQLQVKSGSVHYWRVHETKYDAVFEAAKAMGLNTIDTYVPWFMHQPTSNATFDFDGPLLNLGKFLDTAATHGLHVMLRVGPYVCAEVDLGGLPSWLLSDDTMRLRSTHGAFLQAVRTFWDELVPKYVVPRLSTRGGPIIAVQVENEYGNHAGALREDGTPNPDGQAYLETLRRMLVDDYAVDVLLFTSDGASVEQQIAGGFQDASKGVIRTVNFGPHVTQATAEDCLAVLDAVQSADVPKMVAELWVGWFDHWGERHHVVPHTALLSPMRHLMSKGVSFNLYMFMGGTNFGLTSGANYFRSYYPTTTSYDYDAPLDESARRRTAKFDAIAALIRDDGEPPPPPSTAESSGGIPVRAYGSVVVDGRLSLLDCPSVWPRGTNGKAPLTQEAIGQRYGWTLYRVVVPESKKGILEVADMRDRMQMWVLGSNVTGSFDTSPLHTHMLQNGGVTAEQEVELSHRVRAPDDRTIGRTVHRKDGVDRSTGRATSRLQLSLHVPHGGGKLELFVENRGRVNMGRGMHESKGISQYIKLHRRTIRNVTTIPFEIDGGFVSSLKDSSCWTVEGEESSNHKPTPELPEGGQGVPAFYRGSMHIPEGDVIGDTYLNMSHWRRGVVFVNGFALGRYSEEGPLSTLFVPAALLHEGSNEILVFEQHAHVDNMRELGYYDIKTRARPRRVTFVASHVPVSDNEANQRDEL